MTKKEICLSHDTIATYYVCVWVGIEIKTIRHGIDYDSVYFISHACDEVGYHKARIYNDIDENDIDETEPYFMWGKIKVRLSECLSNRI